LLLSLPLLLTNFLNGLPNPGQRLVLPQHFHRLKQRRGVLAAAHGDADRLKHLSSLQAESLRGGAFLRPHTATRIGWNICPAFTPNSWAAARRA